jgi:rhamnulokinase
VEATATGNLIVQAVAAGSIGSLAAGRRLVAESHPPVPFEPRDPGRWERQAAIYRDVSGCR